MGATANDARPSPFDSIKITDPSSTFGRIVTRLRGYHPTQQETDAFRGAARNVVYTTLGVMGVCGFAGSRFAAYKKWTPFQRFVMATGGSMIGFWIGSSISTTQAAKTVLNMQGSYIAKVVREEAFREEGIPVSPSEFRVDDGRSTPSPPIQPSLSTRPEWAKKAAQATQEKSGSIKEYEDFEDELWKEPAPEKAASGKPRRYNQYGDVEE
ncbi:hypothetical protein BC830DRAFT_1153723 [Chytriomyces sp. MP71]|nr:hypothetical protein BC830DRAFT_1153723 [Chytriomyces sp. MP71]